MPSGTKPAAWVALQPPPSKKPAAGPKQSFYSAFRPPAAPAEPKSRGPTRPRLVPSADLGNIVTAAALLDRLEQGKECHDLAAVLSAAQLIQVRSLLASQPELPVRVTVVVFDADKADQDGSLRWTSVDSGVKLMPTYRLVGGGLVLTETQTKQPAKQTLTLPALADKARDSHWTPIRLTVPKCFVAETTWRQLSSARGLAAFVGSVLRMAHVRLDNARVEGTGRSEALSTIIRVAKPEEVLQLSGQQGLFAKRCGVAERPAVAWLRPEDRSAAEYLEHALRAAGGKPLSWRAGGGSCLGWVDPATQRSQRFLLSGAPRGWGAPDILELLEAAEWQQARGLSPPQHHGQPWLFTATAREGDSWVYDLAEADTVVTVRPWLAKPRPPVPRRDIASFGWTTYKPTTAMDTDDAAPPAEPKHDSDTPPGRGGPTGSSGSSGSSGPGGGGTEATTPAAPGATAAPPVTDLASGKRVQDAGSDGDSGKRPRTTTTLSPALNLGAIVEMGGQGDCGWRSVCGAMAWLNGKGGSLENPAELDKAVRQLRSRAAGRLTQTLADWESAWHPSEWLDEVTDAGPQCMDAKAWVEAVATWPRRFICQRTLQAVVDVLSVTLVVVSHASDGSAATAARFSPKNLAHSARFVAVSLCNGHHRAIKDPPSGWLQSAAVASALPRGGVRSDVSSSASWCSLLDGPQTGPGGPSRRTPFSRAVAQDTAA